jgi:formate hydrogenlyase subunit 6/NADH:ubiquinone oxidoreductase subunit I
MDGITKLLKQASLEKLVQKFREEEKIVYAPVKKNGQVNFEAISSLKEMTEEYITTAQSAKSIVFPKVESLLDMHSSKESYSIKEKDFSQIPETVLLGARPCDAAGFDSLTAIFTWDYIDTIYTERLRKTTVIGMSCSKCDSKCFCTSVNQNPGGTRGSDILLTKIESGDYIAEIVSEKGQAIAAKNSDLFEDGSNADKSKYIVDVPVKFDLKTIIDNISNAFDNELWVEQSLRCISCGACAYVCPTCACFDIQDIFNGHDGKRKRSWDSCGFGLFTLHTSGHNPREIQSQRWRQRIMHKFAYMPERQQVVGCVGCGRCSRACPVDMNLKEHLINLNEEVVK